MTSDLNFSGNRAHLRAAGLARRINRPEKQFFNKQKKKKSYPPGAALSSV